MNYLKEEAKDIVNITFDKGIGLSLNDKDPVDSERKDTDKVLASDDEKVASGDKIVTENIELDVVNFLKKNGATTPKKAVLISVMARDMKNSPLAGDLKRKLGSMKNVVVTNNSAYYSE